jgi:DNA-directed RNA polymerase I subunit RPA43
MLSLVGSIQPDPFSPKHVPQTKPGRVQSPQSYSRTHTVPDSNESGESDVEELDAPARSGQSDNDAVRNAKGGQNKAEKKARKQEEKKRKRNRDNAPASKPEAKSEPKAKRKKAS